MKRRSLFKLFAAATAAVAMEVMGVSPMTKGPAQLYAEAEYETVFIMHPRVAKMMGFNNLVAPVGNVREVSGPPQDRWDFVAGEWKRRAYYPGAKLSGS